MQLESLLTSRLTVNALQSRTPEGAFEEVAEALAGASIVPREAAPKICESFLVREKSGSTSLGFGLAVPHIFHDDVKGVHLVVARSDAGVDLGAPDGRPVRILFCLVAAEAERTRYLAALGSVVRVARDKDYRRLMERAGAAAQVVDYLMQGDRALGR
jgi:mannitol/fructose-specific phosphotransferase system IIA component (Ntr-type)